MKLETLREAIRLQKLQRDHSKTSKQRVPQVRIRREVRYFASFMGAEYALVHDWFNEVINEKLDAMSNANQGKE